MLPSAGPALSMNGEALRKHQKSVRFGLGLVAGYFSCRRASAPPGSDIDRRLHAYLPVNSQFLSHHVRRRHIHPAGSP